MLWSPQQQAVFDWVDTGQGSTFVEAVAGAGKTTTLIEACAHMNGSVAFAAFNKKIASEIQARLAAKGLSNVARAGTFHSFGFGAWRKVAPKVKVDAREKQATIVGALAVPKPLEVFVFKLVSIAKQGALGVFGSPDDDSRWWKIIDHHDMTYDLPDAENSAQVGVDLAKKALALSNDMAMDLIDFDDMIYLPVLKGVRMWQNDWILVDEAQDTNPARRALARKMLLPKGRAIFVGDRHQAIYGFTGADSDAVDHIIRDFKCSSLPLTVTYRCPKTVVKKAQEVVSHIQAHDSAPDGEVSFIQEEDLLAQGLTPKDAILCRNTKPLVQTAFLLIRNKIAAHVEGKDIGAGLLKLVNRFSARTLQQLRDKLEAFLDKEVQKLIAKGKETQAEALQDRVETVFVIADGYSCQSIDDLRGSISGLFADTDNGHKATVTLSTVHKAKGREWERVFVIGHNIYMPSKYARQEWQMEQERNLMYVAYTRAMSKLVLVESPVQR